MKFMGKMTNSKVVYTVRGSLKFVEGIMIDSELYHGIY